MTKEELIELQDKIIELTRIFWEEQDKRDKKMGFYKRTVKYLKHKFTGQMVVVTRGEYSDQLIDYIESLP